MFSVVTSLDVWLIFDSPSFIMKIINFQIKIIRKVFFNFFFLFFFFLFFFLLFFFFFFVQLHMLSYLDAKRSCLHKSHSQNKFFVCASQFSVQILFPGVKFGPSDLCRKCRFAGCVPGTKDSFGMCRVEFEKFSFCADGLTVYDVLLQT